jgi:quercetin dioxygenase-like cupin family protein
MTGRHEDERGVIQDLLGPVDSVTYIATVKGAVRGNHVHRNTDQWTYVVSGRLLSVRGDLRRDVGPGKMVAEPKGVPHAWKALEDTVCLVFTKGPRAGEAYESDTYRLNHPLLV